MKYVYTHKRKVRGESVHVVKEKKDKEKKGKSQGETESPELGRKKVEATYLTPVVKNYIMTKEVKEIEDRLRLWLNVGYPVHLIGPTGCGKTTMAMHAASKLGRPVVWINGDETVTTTDLVGGYSQVEAESTRDKYIHNVYKSKDILKADWVDNPLTLACKYGYTLVYNEFSRAKPDANNVLLSVFEEGILELPTKFGEERYVKVHPDFKAILTSNSIEYAGVHRAQDALLDRLVGVYMDYYDFDTEVKIVRAHAKVPAKKAKEIVKAIRGIRDRVDITYKPGTRACLMLARGVQGLNGHDVDFEQLLVDVIASKTRGVEDLSVIKEALGRT